MTIERNQLAGLRQSAHYSILRPGHEPDKMRERQQNSNEHTFQDADPDHAGGCNGRKSELVHQFSQVDEMPWRQTGRQRGRAGVAPNAASGRMASGPVSQVTTRAITPAAVIPTSADLPPEDKATAVRLSAPVTANPWNRPAAILRRQNPQFSIWVVGHT